jgi:hypothetical protein
VDNCQDAAWHRTPAWWPWTSAGSSEQTASSRSSGSLAQNVVTAGAPVSGSMVCRAVDRLADRDPHPSRRGSGVPFSQRPSWMRYWTWLCGLRQRRTRGRVDLSDLGRPARHLLASTTGSAHSAQVPSSRPHAGSPSPRTVAGRGGRVFREPRHPGRPSRDPPGTATERLVWVGDDRVTLAATQPRTPAPTASARSAAGSAVVPRRSWSTGT